MEQTFVIGARFQKFKYISIAVNLFLIFTFYFIYRYLFANAVPSLVGTPLAILFLAAALLTAKLTAYAFDTYAASISYQLTQEGLLVKQGKQTQLYRWEDFRSVRFRDGSFQNVYPVEFQVGDISFLLNQHIQGLCRLTYEIFLRIQDHVSLSPHLVEKTYHMIDVY